MDFVVENEVEVLEKASLKGAPEGLLADLLTAMARWKKRDSDGMDGGDELSTMRIDDLRKKAHKRGLDIDGSREVLVAALEENRKRPREYI